MIHSSHQKVKKKGVHNEFDEKAIVDFVHRYHFRRGLRAAAVRAGLNLLLGGTLFGGNIL